MRFYGFEFCRLSASEYVHSLALAYLNAVEVHIVFNDLVFFSFRAAIFVRLKSLRIVCDYIIDMNYPLLCLFLVKKFQICLCRPSIEKLKFFELREIITDIDGRYSPVLHLR